MWLINSPIGRKVVMSVTGICLILFLTFHACMNVVALFSGKAYNMICELLGANWYAVAATLGLAFLAVCHIVFAFWLTMQNRKARGSERYAVTERRPEVSWASQNMLVLGIIILLGLLLHLFNFWYNMMFAELVGIEGLAHGPADGFGWWSAMQTIGINGKIWFNRWKVIGIIYVTILMALFLIVVLAFAFGLAPSLCCDGGSCCEAAAACC